MRHSSMSDSTMHFSPHTSQLGRPLTGGGGMLRAHSMAVNGHGDPAMARNGGVHFRGPGTLLSELQAQRVEHGSMDSVHPFWQQQMVRFCFCHEADTQLLGVGEERGGGVGGAC